MGEVTVVNIVGAGLVNREFDLNRLAIELGEKAQYEPEMYPGLYLQLEDEGPLTIVYRTGRFIVTGAKSENEIHMTKQKAINTLADAVGGLVTLYNFDLCNYVLLGDLGKELNLSAIAIELGLERTEYDPNRFPAVLYRPDDSDCTAMIFRSGKVNIVGENSRERSEMTFEKLKNKIESLLTE